MTMNSMCYFDACALILFSGLIISVLRNKFIFDFANKVLLFELICGVLASAFGFASSLISFYTAPSNISVILLRSFKNLNLFFQLLLLQLNSIYFYSSLKVINLIKRNVFIALITLITFFLPFGLLVSNFFLQNLFFVTPTLNIGTSPWLLIFYELLVILLARDCLIIAIYHKNFDSKIFLLLIPSFILNALFLILQCIIPEFKAELIINAISLFILISYIQKPDLMKNPVYNALPEQSFFQTAKRFLNFSTSASVAFIKIKNYKNLKLYIGQHAYIETLRKISSQLDILFVHYQLEGNVYYLGHGVYALLSTSKSVEKKNKFINQVTDEFNHEFQIEDFKIIFDLQIALVEIPKDINDIEQLKQFSKIFDHIIPKGQPVVRFPEISSDKDFVIKNHLKEIVIKAIKDNHLEVYYQPIYGIEEKKFVSAEALVRIIDPVYGVISPSLFIPFAEQYDFIHLICDFVFESVCKFISSDDFKNSNLKYIEMNLSSAQCCEPDFVNKITRLMEKYHVTTDEIRFDITEKVAGINSTYVEKTISDINNLGIKFTLDGYGTGYSNVKKIVSIPFDIVKFDNTFVQKNSDPATKIIIESTIHMFRQMGKKVLLEGIETEQLHREFMDFKCDMVQPCSYMQGFYYSKPLPQKNFIQFISTSE